MGSSLHTVFVTVCLWAGLSGVALAHESWLSLDSAKLDATRHVQKIKLSMTSGERFPIPQLPIKPDRMDQAHCRSGSMQSALSPAGLSAKTLLLTAEVPDKEPSICWVQLKARALNLDLAKVEQYLREIDASDAVRLAWQQSPEPKTWHESYTKNAKLHLLPPGVHSTVPDNLAPVGLALELVVDERLFTGRKGDRFGVQALRHGQPIQGLSISLHGAKTRKTVRQRTDAAGAAQFDVPASGQWMLSATDLRSTNSQLGEWESQFTTTAFEKAARH